MSTVTDTFTDTAAANVTSHTSDSGHTWSRHVSYSGNTVITDANRARHGDTTPNLIYVDDWTPASADYDVSVDIYCKTASDTTDRGVGPAGRIDTAINQLVYIRYESGNNNWILCERIAGTENVRDTHTGDVHESADTSKTVKLELRGTTAKGYLDGVEVLSATLTTVTAAGFAGLRGRQTSASNTTGYHYDNFTATDDIGGGTVDLDASAGVATASGGTLAVTVVLLAAAGAATAGGGTATASSAGGPVNLDASGGTATAAGGTVTLAWTVIAAAGVSTASGGTVASARTVTAASGVGAASGGTVALTVVLSASAGVATASGPTVDISLTLEATSGVATAAGGAATVGAVTNLTAAGGTATAGGTNVPLVWLWLATTGTATATGGNATASGLGAGPATESHPSLGGIIDQTVTGGIFDETPTGGRVNTLIRGGTVRIPTRGGRVLQPAHGGIVTEPKRGGTHDETGTGGEVY